VAPDRRRPARGAAERATAGSPVAAFLEREVTAGCAERVLDLVRSERWGSAERLAASLARRWGGRHPVRTWSAGSANRALRRLELPVPGHPRGLVVALVGPDGAGKTTLSETLQARVPLPTRSVYMGLWQQSPWDRPLSRVPGGRVLQRTSRIVRNSLAVRRHGLRGRLVVLDRFTQDALLPGGTDTSRGGRLNLRLAMALDPRPQLVLLLDAPGEVMFARKGEHSPELLEERRQAYLELVARFPESVVLDATRPEVEVARAALAAVWRTIDERPQLEAAGDPQHRPGGRRR
jgi:thymidylate kinase